jgi:hypothetical protein
MMPMQMPRKSRTIRKVENLSRTANSQNILQHAGTNQITFARFGGQIFSRPVSLFEHVLLDVMASAKRVPGPGAEPALFALGGLPASPARSACLTLAQRQDRSAPILPDMSHFAAEFDEYCANPARSFQGTPKFGRIGLTFLRCSVTRFRVHRSQQQESWTCVFTTFARR